MILSGPAPANETARIGAADADTGLTTMDGVTPMTAVPATTLHEHAPASAIAGLPTASPAPPPSLPVRAALSPAHAASPSPRPREPGVYFGLPEAEHHADPSLGSTDLKRLLRSTMDYWWGSCMNPRREPEAGDTPAKRQGRALHKLVLEGRAALHKAYIAEPQPEDWPDALRTQDDMREFLKSRGDKVSGTKPELAKRIKAVAPEIVLWDDVLAHFAAMIERDGLQVLKPDAFAEVEVAGHMVALNRHLANAFKDGVAEVSVFWRDADGVPCKARFDYLKPRTIADLKKCENKGEHPFPTACRLALRSYGYDMQVAHYLEGGYPALLALAREGRIFGDCPLPAGFVDRMAAAEDMLWTFVFHQTSGAPVTYGMEIETGSPVLAKARADVAAMKRRWLDCMERFGTDEWVSEDPIHRLSVEEMPYEWRVAAELEAA